MSLRVISEHDYDYLYELLNSAEVGARWVFRGEALAPDQFVRTIWHNVLCQYLAVPNGDEDEIAAYVVAYDARLRDGHCKIGVVVDPDLQRQGWPLESVSLMLDHVFANWDFEKVYFETYEFNYDDALARMDHFATEEARLRNHVYQFGRRWDLLIHSIDRKSWTDLASVRGLFPPETAETHRGQGEVD